MLRYYKVKVWPYKNQALLYSKNKTVRQWNITPRKNIRTLKNSTDWFNNISTIILKTNLKMVRQIKLSISVTNTMEIYWEKLILEKVK